MYINEDIRPKLNVALIETTKKVNLLEQRAINKLNGKMRPILHKGFYKHHPWEFKMPRDKVAEREHAKAIDRERRLRNFRREMESVDIEKLVTEEG